MGSVARRVFVVQKEQNYSLPMKMINQVFWNKVFWSDTSKIDTELAT